MGWMETFSLPVSVDRLLERDPIRFLMREIAEELVVSRSRFVRVCVFRIICMQSCVRDTQDTDAIASALPLV